MGSQFLGLLAAVGTACVSFERCSQVTAFIKLPGLVMCLHGIARRPLRNSLTVCMCGVQVADSYAVKASNILATARHSDLGVLI